MKNIITIIAILIIPIFIYSTMSENSDKTIVFAKNDNIPTLMTYSSTMCLDCQKMKGIINEIKDEYNEKINFIGINATEKSKTTKELVKQYNVTLVPTMIFIDKDNNEVNRIEGAITKEELKSELDRLCNG